MGCRWRMLTAKGPAHALHLVRGDEVRLPDVVKAGSTARGACRNWSSSRGAVVVEPFFNIAEVVFVQTVPLSRRPNRQVRQAGRVDPFCLPHINNRLSRSNR